MKPSVLIGTNGEMKHMPPAGKYYTLEELQKAVGGYIEILPSPQGNMMVVNEEGNLQGLPMNFIASEIMRRPIVGDVLYADPEHIEIGE